MMDAPITHHTIDRAVRLIKFAYSIPVKLDGRRRAGWGDSQIWNLDRQSICVGARLSPPAFQWGSVLAAIAHELGHCLSARRGSLTTEDVYAAFWTTALPLTEKHVDSVLAEERRAYKLGFKWLRTSGFLVTDDMQYQRRDSERFNRQYALSRARGRKP